MFGINMMTRMLLMAKEICYAIVCMGHDDADDKTNMLFINCSAWGVRDTEPPDFSWASPILILHAEADDAARELIMMRVVAVSPGQVWVINSNFYLQLNLCVCYRENQFGLIVGPGRALLTLPRSHICPVNKFVRKKSS